jgi:Alpha/beta hydrolase of unknown function (DUF900)
MKEEPEAAAAIARTAFTRSNDMTRLSAIRRLLAVVVALALAACGEIGFLDKPEKRLGLYSTWYGTDLRIYHSALFSPEGEALSVPGYVVGIENIRRGNDNVVVNGVRLPSEPGYAITHVVRYDQTPGDRAGQSIKSCVLYTMIDRDRSGPGAADPGSFVFDRCSRDRDEKRDETSGVVVLGHDLEQAIRDGRLTHIVLVVMGWNTDQTEAIKNYNAIAGNLVLEARRRGDEAFRPVVIGVTWPSLWKLSSWSVVPDAVVRGVSFPWISSAADDIGQYVITYVIQHVLEARKAVGRPIPITLIGHSFGARVLMLAIDSAWERGPGQGYAPQRTLFNDADRLILLEGAFQIHKLFESDGTLAGQFRGSAPRVTMVASRYDNAVATAFWGWYAGDIRSFDQVCRENEATWRYWDYSHPFGRRDLDVSSIGCGIAKRDGQYGYSICHRDDAEQKGTGQGDDGSAPLRRPLGDKGLRYFDASDLVNCNEPFTGGGAHSDIYRAETARFILDEMK